MRLISFLSVLLPTFTLARAGLGADWTLKLGQGKAEPGGGLQSKDKGKSDVVASQVLAVTCDNTLDCMKVSAFQSDAAGTVEKLAPSQQTSKEVKFQLRHELAANKDANLKVQHDANLVFEAFLQPAGGGAGARSTATVSTEATTLTKLLSTACPQKAFDITPYDAATNRAAVVITARGNVTSAHPSDFDEDDTLKVTLYGDTRLIPLLKVQRKSAFRVVGGINILGADVQVPATLIRQAEGEEPPPICSEVTFELGDFAPGRGEVEISIMSGMDALVVGGFEFSVHALYTGMFTVGGLWTTLLDPGFEVATRGGEPVIVQTESGDSRFAYSFLYTPFLWGKRDIEKGPDAWYQRVNPSLGFVLDDPLDNLLVGASMDIASSILVTGGALFSHVDKLDGVAVGEAFAGTTAELPITRVWRYKAFVGVSLDLRAAVALVQKVIAP